MRNLIKKSFIDQKIAILIPCLNEESTIYNVVKSFKKIYPKSEIYVFDNGSSDNSMEEAKKSGALVFKENRKGKGNVIRRMFADIDADIYILVDADGQNLAHDSIKLISTLVNENLDMVVGRRNSQVNNTYRFGHKLGNIVITKLVSIFFENSLNDILSGYRVFTKRFIKSFPAQSSGFELETELTIHALDMRLPISEIPVQYLPRNTGTHSKLKTGKDGIRIILILIDLVRDIKPLFFFSSLSLIFISLSIFLAFPLFEEFIQTSEVPRLPTAVLCTGLALIGSLSLFVGFILDSLARGRRELKRMRYLSYKGLK